MLSTTVASSPASIMTLILDQTERYYRCSDQTQGNSLYDSTVSGRCFVKNHLFYPSIDTTLTMPESFGKNDHQLWIFPVNANGAFVSSAAPG